jgi:hypothetical protein
MPCGAPSGIVGVSFHWETTMIRNRFRTRFLSLLAILTTAMTSLVAGATAASAMQVPDPATGAVSNVVYVPTPPITQVVHDSQGLQWWAIVLIGVTVALVAAALTELYHWMHNRRDHITFSTA